MIKIVVIICRNRPLSRGSPGGFTDFPRKINMMNTQIRDNIAYVATWNKGLHVFDIYDSRYPILFDTFGAPLS
jgi:hypothetical protein